MLCAQISALTDVSFDPRGEGSSPAAIAQTNTSPAALAQNNTSPAASIAAHSPAAPTVENPALMRTLKKSVMRPSQCPQQLCSHCAFVVLPLYPQFAPIVLTMYSHCAPIVLPLCSQCLCPHHSHFALTQLIYVNHNLNAAPTVLISAGAAVT